MSLLLYYIKRMIRAIGKPLRVLRGHQAPEAETIPVMITGLPAAFEQYTIAVVADLHLPDYLSTPAQIVAVLSDIRPHCILLPGDLTNRYAAFDRVGIADFLQQLVAIAPCYAVAGNHERSSARFSAYRALLEDAGVILVDDQWVFLQKDNAQLPLYGVCDTQVPLPASIPSPALLLLHYPERAACLDDSGFSLAICGHAHGGQIRFRKRGLYAPGQGFFPRYISGLYRFNRLQMVVSRGLGDSSLPLRLHNRPHLPVIQLIPAPTV